MTLVIEVHPLVHPAELDVADAVVDRCDEAFAGGGGRGRGTGRAGDVTGQVGTVVAGAVDEAVAGVAVRRDRGDDDGAVLVGDLRRRLQPGGAVRDRVGVLPRYVRHGDRQVADAVAVRSDVLGEIGPRTAPDRGSRSAPSRTS